MFRRTAALAATAMIPATAALLLAASALAFDPSDIRARPATTLDSLRAEAERARLSLEWGRAAALRSAILARTPGDPFAQREIAIEAMDRGLLADLGRALERPGSKPPIPIPDLRAGDRDLLAGLTAFYRKRHRSAIERLEAAIASRPGDGWARVYRARAGIGVLEPRAVWERHLNEALSDREAAPLLADWILGGGWAHLEASSVQKAEERLFAATRAVPWTADAADEVVLRRRIESASFRAQAFDSAWQAIRAAHGVAAANWISRLGYSARIQLAPGEALALFDRWGAGAPRGIRERWLLERAFLLDAIDRDAAAEAVYAETPLPDARVLGRRLLIRKEDDPPDRLAEAAHRMAGESLESVETASWMLDMLGRSDEANDLRTLASREHPLSVVFERLDALTRSDWNAAKALVDSLEGSGFPMHEITWYRVRVGEQHGDTLSESGLLGMSPPGEDRAAWGAAMEGAYVRGRAARGDRLFRRYLEHAKNDPNALVWLGHDARRRNRHDQLRELLIRIQKVCPACPVTDEPTVAWLAALGDYDAARAHLRARARDPENSAQHLALLAAMASSLRENGLAESLLTAAERGNPTNRYIRLIAARRLASSGDAAGAGRIAKEILERFPRDERALQILAASGGQETKPPRAEAGAAGFDVFGHDLTSAAWIVEALAAPDTSLGSYLLARTSYACQGDQGCRIRKRVVIRLTSPQAVEAFRTMRLTFFSWDTPPTVRTARVIHPDGRIVDVPRNEILVASPENADPGMIHDRRDLVVPFSGAKPGSAIDLVFDREPSGIRIDPWSFRDLLAEALPARQVVLEVAAPEGSRLRFRASGTTSPAERARVGAYGVDRWVARNVPALTEATLSGSFYDRYPWVASSGSATWSESVQEYRLGFWQQVVVTDEIRSLAASLTRGAKTPGDRLRAIASGLASKVQYLAVEIGRGRVIPTPAAEVLRRGYGDCKDMVTLGLALLEAAGVRAEPVLVVDRGTVEVIPDLPEPGLFDHMILWVPGAAGGTYTDLTIRPACAGAIGAGYEGTQGLRFGRAGEASLVTLPSGAAGSHGYSMEIDVRPRGDAVADIEVRARYRGELARAARTYLTHPDSAVVTQAVDRVLGFGLPATASRRSWRIERDDCASLVASATYADTAWSKGSHSVLLAVRDEVADPLIVLPNPKNRAEGLRLEHGYRDTVVVRLHGGGGWEPVGRVAATRIVGDYFDGQVSVAPGRGPGTTLEVRQTFDMRRRDLGPAEYREFHRKWLRFQASVYQPYRFRRVLDRERIAQVTRYAREHPDDLGFAVQAVNEILGDDLGGDGPEGDARRNACRELLRPLRADPSVGPTADLHLAAIAIQEGRYREADSLGRIALVKEAGNLSALAMLAGTSRRLGNVEEELKYSRELARRSPNDEVQIALLVTLYGRKRDDEARQIESRLASLHGAFDSVQVCMARLAGYLGSDRCDEARQAIGCLRGRVDERSVRMLESSALLDCGRMSEAASLLEELWLEDPLDPLLCNNLAWSYALLGRDLDLAEEIARTAVTLAGSPSDRSGQNTLGAVHARRGRWKEARALFTEILKGEEDIESRASNEYFVGLCDYQLGAKGEAVRRWKAILPEAPPGEWKDRIAKSLELASQGAPVTSALWHSDAGAVSGTLEKK